MRPTSEQIAPATPRVLQFDYRGKRVRPAVSSAPLNPPLSAEPDDRRSAIEQAILRWLNEE